MPRRYVPGGRKFDLNKRIYKHVMNKTSPGSLNGMWQILKNSISGFLDDKVMKLSGALAFYMVFSMGPLLLIVITLCSIFFGRESVEGKVYAQLVGFVGQNTAFQLQQIIKNAAISGKNELATVIGVCVLIIGATSVFAEMQ